MHIHHLTLNTGHITHVRPGDVSGETVARVAPWLRALVESGKKHPLPASSLAAYTAQATVDKGALLCSVFGRTGDPLVTIGVAARSRHTAPLWASMTASGMPARPGLKPPAHPWCAVLVWPGIADDFDAAMWIGDFERCVAWAWVARPD